MACFSFHWPRFLCFYRSHLRLPSTSSEDPLNDSATTFSSLDLDPPSSPPCGLGIPEQGADTSHPPGRGSLVDCQTYTGGPLYAKHLDDCDGLPLPAPCTGSPKGIVPSNRTHIPDLHGPTTEHSPRLTSPSNHTDSPEAPHYLASVPVPYPLTAHSQSSSNSSHAAEYSSQLSSKKQHRSPGMFHEAHGFTVTGTFVDGNVGNVNINTSNQFMEKFLKETIPGAASDSSDRDPPPRCHPGTRLAILERCLSFIRNCDGQRKVRWVVGAAGVGKSAVMQSVAESPELPVNYHASVFLSINGRNDGAKVIITISYQFSANSRPYRQLIEEEIARDPSLFQSSMTTQFLRLIVDPFIHNHQLNPADRILVIIDGLDECKNPRTQLELLRLVTDLCITYPSSPLVWLIASRPETHITSFFASAEAKLTYEKEEIIVDSNEARADVERFLRDELMKIKQQASDLLGPQWPEERHVWILAYASGGLFAYAATVIRYIGDSTISSPASQLSDVLNIIDNHPMTGISPEEHPMALLDALYARILSHVPPRIWMNTRKLLLALASNWNWDYHIKGNFIVLCNWLDMTPDEAYAALNHLHSVLSIPRRNCAHLENLEAFHKSFIDYISDFSRFQFSLDIEHEARQISNECTFRVLKEAPDGINFSDGDYDMLDGCLALGPGTGDNISLTWPVDEGVDWDDNETRLRLYQLAMGEVVAGMRRGDSTFQNEFCVRLLTTRFQGYTNNFPCVEMRDFVFDESRCREFTRLGILKLIPLKEVDFDRIVFDVTLRFRSPAAIEAKLSDPWNSSCEHEREGIWEEGKEQNWTTVFGRYECGSCLERLNDQWKNWKVQSPDQTVPVLFTSTGKCCVEVCFVDPEDGTSRWTYWFWIRPSAEGHKDYESPV